MEPIEWSDGTVVITDGRLMPDGKASHICRDYPEVCEAIRSGAIRDSSALCIAAAMGIALGAQRSLAKTVEEFDGEFGTICVAITAARPGNQNITSVVRQFRSTYHKYRASGMLVVRVALLVEALVLQAEESVAARDVPCISDGDVQHPRAHADTPPAVSP